PAEMRNSRSQYAHELRKTFLSSGLSLWVGDYEGGKGKGDRYTPDKYPYPRLVIQGSFMSDPLIFKIAGEAGLLKAAAALGFKVVHFSNISGIGPSQWLFDLSAGIPTCDVEHRVCL